MILPVAIEGYIIEFFYHPWDLIWILSFDSSLSVDQQLMINEKINAYL